MFMHRRPSCRQMSRLHSFSRSPFLLKTSPCRRRVVAVTIGSSLVEDTGRQSYLASCLSPCLLFSSRSLYAAPDSVPNKSQGLKESRLRSRFNANRLSPLPAPHFLLLPSPQSTVSSSLLRRLPLTRRPDAPSIFHQSAGKER